MDIVLSREQVRRVDRLAIDRFHMHGLVLMENAGRNAAEIIHHACPSLHADIPPLTAGGTTDSVERPLAAICCGPGNNGGDGFVIARHLCNRGWAVRVLLAGDPARLSPDAGANWRIVEAMDLSRTVTTDPAKVAAFLGSLPDHAVILDALLGTGFQGAVREPTASHIHAINRAKDTERKDAGRSDSGRADSARKDTGRADSARKDSGRVDSARKDTGRLVVAVDVPSGLDCDTGEPSNATIRADWTITFVARKSGFSRPAAAPFVGRVFVADIGVPRSLIDEVAGNAKGAMPTQP
jgi:NAD(P)H-hydrate epimerase